MKTISIFLALINSLIAGLIIIYSFSSSELHQAEVSWAIVKVAACMSVIMLGILTWIVSIRETKSGSLLAGGLFLVVFGAVSIMWTIHLAIIDGEMEYYMLGYGASLMVQGLSSLLGFTGESSAMTFS